MKQRSCTFNRWTQVLNGYQLNPSKSTVLKSRSKMQTCASAIRSGFLVQNSKPKVSRPLFVKCATSDPDPIQLNRRGVATLTGSLGFHSFTQLSPGLALLTAVPESLALLPDDDDLDLVEKAKAKRRARLQKELESEKQFVRTGGLRSADDAKLVTSVQKAVFNLAKSGARLNSGDLSEVSSLLTDEWVYEFETASKDLSIGVDGGPEGVNSIFSGLVSLQKAASKGDLTNSKKQYIVVVDAMKDWTKRTGIQSKLKGL